MRNFLMIFAVIFCASNAFAIFEGRLTYGMLVSKPDMTSLYGGALTLPSAAANYGTGFDAIFNFPLSNWGLGMRYENLGSTASGSGLDFKSVATRSALIVNYRLWNTGLHIGPLFTYGLSHTNGMTVTATDVPAGYDWKPAASSSYSLGFEAGVALGTLLIGAEFGQETMKWDKMTDALGSSSSTPNTDMSGTYAKIFFGFGL